MSNPFPPIVNAIVSDGLALSFGQTTDVQPVGTAAAGVLATAARADHVHAHGNQAGGTTHAAANNTAAGFVPALSGTAGNVLTDSGSGAANWSPLSVTTAQLGAGAVTEAKLATGLSVPVPTFAKANLPAPDGKARIAKLTDGSRALVQSNGIRWQTATSYDPRDFGAVGDGVTNDLPAFDAMMLALSATGGRITLPPESNFYLASSWHIYRPVVIEGAGGGFIPTSKFTLAPGAAIVLDSGASSPVGGMPGAVESVLKNFAIFGNAGAAPPWRPSTAYSLGAVVLNPQWYGGFTQLVYRCVVSGTSSASAPAFTVRDEVNGFNTEGTTFADGGVTWQAVSSPGVFLKTVATLDHLYFQQILGDAIYAYGYSGISPGTNCNGFQLIKCSSQLCLGRGLYVEGTDAQAGSIDTLLAQNNWSGGIYDNSDIGNLYSSCLLEANGIYFWTPKHSIASYDPLGVGVPTTVPSRQAMDAMQTTVGKVYYYTLQSSSGANVGVSEPVWPTTIGSTVSDGSAIWKCAGVYPYGQAYYARLSGLNESVFIGCYEEPDQRYSELVAPTVWIGGIGGFFRPSNTVWVQRNQDSSAYVYRSRANVSPGVQTVVGDNEGVAGALKFSTLNASSGIPENDYKLLPTTNKNYWTFAANGGTNGSLQLSNVGAAEGSGHVVLSDRLYVRGVSGGTKAWSLSPWGLDTTNAPPDSTQGQVGDILVQPYQPNNSSVLPDAYLCRANAPGAVWDEANFDKQRRPKPIFQGVGSPFVVANVSGSINRNQVFSNIGTATKVAVTLPVAAGLSSAWKYHFANEQPGGSWRINAAAGQTIAVGGVVSSVGGYIETTDPNAFLTLESCFAVNVWTATSVVGNWYSDNGAGLAAPTAGAHVVGERVINSAPAELGAAGNKYVVQGWVCTVAGTPGTWLQQRTLTGN